MKHREKMQVTMGLEPMTTPARIPQEASSVKFLQVMMTNIEQALKGLRERCKKCEVTDVILFFHALAVMKYSGMASMQFP